MKKQSGVLGVGLLLLALLAGVWFIIQARRPVAPPSPAVYPRTAAPGSGAGAAPPRILSPDPASGSPTPPGRPIRPVREQLRLAGSIVQAFFIGKRASLPPGMSRPEDWATNLPVGWFQLLVRAFPDEAFEVFSAQYLGDPDHATVAYWALGELARLRHEATFQLFNAQLEGGDPVRTRRALKVMANYDAPQLGPRILALVPADPKNPDECELAGTAMRVAATTSSADPARLDRLLEHFAKRAREDNFDPYGTAETRLLVTVMRSADLPAALAQVVAKESEEPGEGLERAEWAADMAVRLGRRELVPALRERIQKTVGRLKEDDRLGELDVLGRQARGEYDVPSTHAFGGHEEVRAISHLRRVILDLGGTLTDEERRWLDGLRMLRTPREYLREAGLIE